MGWMAGIWVIHWKFTKGKRVDLITSLQLGSWKDSPFPACGFTFGNWNEDDLPALARVKRSNPLISNRQLPLPISFIEVIKSQWVKIWCTLIIFITASVIQNTQQVFSVLNYKTGGKKSHEGQKLIINISSTEQNNGCNYLLGTYIQHNWLFKLKKNQLYT